MAIEANGDAVADMTHNMSEADNAALYQGLVEEILPHLPLQPGIIVTNPPASGMPPPVIEAMAEKQPARIVYVSSEVASLARDGRQLRRAGYELSVVQPVDVMPQTYQVETVSLWLANPET